MTGEGPALDVLIARLKARVADPERRVDQAPTAFSARVSGLDAGGLFGQLRQGGLDLRRTLHDVRRGAVDDDLVAKAESYRTEMATPVHPGLRPTADEASLAAAEARLGFRLPGTLRRIYAEVADGGFGPGTGLLPIARAAALYLELRAGDSLPRGQRWPERLLPLVEDQPVIECIEAGTESGRIVTWDAEDLRERSNAAAWNRSFHEGAASLEAWLESWLTGPTPDERFEATYGDQMQDADIRTARESRAMIAAMTPEQRAAMGLPEIGWERVVWGGLGLDDDEAG